MHRIAVVRLLALVLPCGFAAPAWCQLQPPLPSPVTVADSALPEAPAVQQSPASSLGSVQGVVADPGGNAYEGVRVTLAGTGANAPPALQATTGNDGSFAFTGVPAGPFQLTLAASGFATRVVSGSLEAGESLALPQLVLLMGTAVSQVQVTATQQEIALAQLKLEEKQRVFGVIPNFYVTYVPHAPPLTASQKFGLAWKSSVDPVTFAVVGIFAGVEQATNSFSGYGQGGQGFAKRYGAGYADTFIGTMIGGAILPSVLKQDPRYFYQGTGTTRSRVLYALSTAVICKGDNGRWQPNYSAILGSLAAGGISNIYYPASDRDGAALTFEDTLIGVAGTAVQNVFQEFFVRKLTPKVPNYSQPKP